MSVLEPVFLARSREEFDTGRRDPAFQSVLALGDRLIEGFHGESFLFQATCLCCERPAGLLVDLQQGGRVIDSKKVPNWRERLECPGCGLNNRQRLMAALVKWVLAEHERASIYLMEQVTPFYRWASKSLPPHEVLGSEYLGYGYRSGDVVKGIRHEDVDRLSFKDGCLDLIVSNDVFEHVPDIRAAFRECARVLAPGGTMIVTTPFFSDLDRSMTRARLTADGVWHLLPPMYHGNPADAQGSLVFTDFGWDLLASFTAAGFADAALAMYASEKYGHLGDDGIVFILRK